MEGPTPVSALIHAATMVTAGVYLIARTHVLFELAPIVHDTAAILGGVTILVAGLIALVQTDIKRVIAYSTMSQIGYMFVGVGLGAYGPGMFHLMTHAFFKALLFMAAGIIIHALSDEQDIRSMGGLARELPWTYRIFLVGALSLAAIPPFSGFFSKDSILASASNGHARRRTCGWSGSSAPSSPALYTFRLLFIVFCGEHDPVRARAPAQGALRGAARDDVAGRDPRRPRGVRRLAPGSRGWAARRRLARPVVESIQEASGGPLVFSSLASLASRRRHLARLALYGRPRRRSPADRARLPWAARCSSTSSTSTRPTTRASTSRPRSRGLSHRVRRGAALPRLARGARSGVRAARRRVAAAQTGLSALYALASPPASPSSSSSSSLVTDRDDHPHLPPDRGAALVWILPSDAAAAGALALLVASRSSRSGSDAALDFDFGAGGLQYEADRTVWFSDLGVSYKVGLYDFSLWLVGLTIVVTAAAIAYGFWSGRERPGVYLGLMLFLVGATVGVFAAQDLLLFYVFWEAMLIPLYVLIGVWGGPGRTGGDDQVRRLHDGGSLLMLVAIIALGLSKRHLRP